MTTDPKKLAERLRDLSQRALLSSMLGWPIDTKLALACQEAADYLDKLAEQKPAAKEKA